MGSQVIKKPDNLRYANGTDIGLGNLGLIALFSNFKLTTCSGKHPEDISHARIVSLMYKQREGAEYTDDLSNGFDRARGRRKHELTNIKNIKGKYHLRIMLKDIFGLAEHQEKATHELS